MGLVAQSSEVNQKHPVLLGCVLLGLTALPDAMVVPVLSQLTVERFGVSEGAAHALMAVNMVGAILVVCVLACINRRLNSSAIFMLAAIASIVLLISMALAPSWRSMLAFRCLEGGADLLLFVIPIRMIAASGKKDRYGGRMGLAFTVMFLALAAGTGFGAIIGKNNPTAVLWAGAVISAIMLLIVVKLRETVDIVNNPSKSHKTGVRLNPKEWVATGFALIDRFLSALLSVTLPILIASGFNVGPKTLGIAIVCMFLTLALFSAPAGILADHFGGLRIRLVSVLFCGLGLMGLGLMKWLPPVVILAPCLILIGIGSAGLMPSVFAACVRREASTLVFSGMQAAGQCGYALGVVGGGILISSLTLSPETIFVRLFTLTGLGFIMINVVLICTVQGINTLMKNTST